MDEPRVTYTRQRCPQCGAETEKDAGAMCQGARTGFCSATGEADSEGYLIALTPESIAAYSAWQDAQG